MPNNLTPVVTLIGLGQMATEYAKVLQHLDIDFIPIGRSSQSCEKFSTLFQTPSYSGGVSKNKSHVTSWAIICTPVEQLQPTALEALEAGVKNILIEKPGGLSRQELTDLKLKADAHKAHVYIAYNRRFLNSVIELKKRAAQDGGITSCSFEFTEWSHVIDKLPDSPAKSTTFISNSTHVVDLAFYLIGHPQQMTSYTGGEKLFSWNEGACRFVGSGITDKKILFSYHANWTSAGRWGVEVMTAAGRYYLRPLEKLSFQKTGTLQIEDISLDAYEKSDLKPGLKHMVEEFVSASNQKQHLPALTEQIKAFEAYERIANTL